MTIMDMLGQSGVLSVLGMSVVFGFLIIMVISVTLMGKVVHALEQIKTLPSLQDRRAVNPAQEHQLPNLQR